MPLYVTVLEAADAFSVVIVHVPPINNLVAAPPAWVNEPAPERAVVTSSPEATVILFVYAPVMDKLAIVNPLLPVMLLAAPVSV